MQGMLRKLSLVFGLITFFSFFACSGGAFARQGEQSVDKWLAELEAQVPKAEAADLGDSPSAAKELGEEGGSGEGAAAKAGGGGGSPLEDVPHISVDFYKIDLHNVFRLLGEVSGKNIVVDESVRGTITLALDDVPWTFVLEVVKNLKGLSSVEKYNTILIFPAKKAMVWAPGAEEEGGGPSGVLEVKQPPEPPKVEIKQSEVEAGPAPEGPSLLIEGESKYKVTVDQVVEAQKYVNLAAEAEKKNDFYTAFNNYKKAAELWPTNVSLAKKVALLALGAQDDELCALNYGKRVLELDPGDSEAATIVAVALARIGKEKEAKVYFERALAAKEVPYKTLYNYAVFRFSHGQYRECLRLINRIEASFPLNADVMLLKARAYEGMGDVRKAIEEYQAVLNAGKGVSADAVMYAQERLTALTK